MPQNSNFWLLRGHRFGQKIELTVMAPIHGGDPLGSILGPMGSHWGQKLGQNRKKFPCPKIRILTTPRSSIWEKNRINGHGTKSRWGTPRVHLGAIGTKKWVKTVMNYHAQKFEFFTTPHGHRFGQKSNLWSWRQITVGTPRVDLGANGVPLGPKNGSKR